MTAMVNGLKTAPGLSMRLLGGFRAERLDVAEVVSGWERRSAKTLTKLLATAPGHALHREQILDIIWPGACAESALNSFGKALHAARHALEPGLPQRESSAYLRMADAMLVLDTDRVVIDADRFEQLAARALQGGDAVGYESALAAYGGELLPEDRYADWCAERRGFLAEMHIRLLLGLAEVLQARGACNASADRLREALQRDPTREVAHRRLMRLYAEMGTPDQAVRQFRLCEEALHRELDLAPEPETISLYHEIRADRSPQPGSLPGHDRPPASPSGPAGAGAGAGRPFIGRDRVVQQLCDRLKLGNAGRAGMVLLSGEAGVGKTRLLEEFAVRADRQGASVLWGGRGAHASQLACGPFAVALEGYAASRPEAERHDLAQRYPALARFVPSLGMNGQLPAAAAGASACQADLIPDMVRLLTELGQRHPVLLVVGDVQGADPASLDLLRYLAQLAVQRPWLIVGTLPAGEAEAGPELRRVIEAAVRDNLCLKIELPCLSRPECDQVIGAMLAGATVSEEFLAEIYLRSRGNPLFVVELSRQLGEPGARVPGGPRGPVRLAPAGLAELAECVPVRVRTLTAMRLTSMDETLRRVLGLAAAGPAEITLGELRAGAAALEPAVRDEALFDALDRALQMRLLEERGSGYAFRHPLVRSAVYQCLSRHRREQLRTALAAPPGAGARRAAARGRDSPRRAMTAGG